jgi:transposase
MPMMERMEKTFRDYDLDQEFLLPPNLRDWLPEGHLALFISDVVDGLDLSAILESYGTRDGRGQPPYHPRMMVKLLIYAYCIGKPSSRKIEQATHDEVPFRVLAAGQHPDHDTLSEFRKQHLKALAGLFLQVLNLCRKAGLVKLGHVALDGTKIKANASKHKAMSYDRMSEKEKQLEEEIARLLKEAEATDAAEDALHGKGKRGDELPPELARRQSRLKKIKEAKAALEAEARERAAAEAELVKLKLAERAKKEEESGRKPGGRPPQMPDVENAVPDPKAQRNFTDPESKIMKDGASKSFEQCYNAQAAVDSANQIILAASATQDANDKEQLVPVMGKVEENVGQMPDAASADSGFFSEAAVQDESLKGVELYVPPDRQKHGSAPDAAVGPEDAPIAPDAQAQPVAGKPAKKTTSPQSECAKTMREKLQSAAGRAIYKMRKAIVEPVFGQIKERRGFRRFSFRGLEKVSAEWTLIALTHNLLKLFKARTA